MKSAGRTILPEVIHRESCFVWCFPRYVYILTCCRHSGSETAQTHACNSSQDPRGTSIRPLTRRLVPYGVNESTATNSGLHNLDISSNPDSRFRGLTPPPLPLAVLPTKKRSIGDMLKDDADMPQQRDKLSRELETMAPYVFRHSHRDGSSTQSGTTTGSSYTTGHHQDDYLTPRTHFEGSRQMCAAMSREQRGTRPGLRVPLVELEDHVTDPGPSGSNSVS